MSARRHDKRVGYIRVSSVDQNTDRQLEGVEIDKVFTDKASGKDTARPQLQAALDYIREGDVLVVHSMDRLARNLDDLRKIVLDLTRKGVHVQFTKENLTFTGEDSPMSNLLLSMLGAVAEFERSMIRERQREGIALAKKAGRYKGRVPSLAPEAVAEVRRLVAAGVPKSKLAKQFKVTRQTIYNALGGGTNAQTKAGGNDRSPEPPAMQTLRRAPGHQRQAQTPPVFPSQSKESKDKLKQPAPSSHAPLSVKELRRFKGKP